MPEPLAEATAADAGARACAVLFAFAVLASFAHIVATGSYNGDFFGVPVGLPRGGLVALVVASLAPYAAGWGIYRWFRQRPGSPTIQLPARRFTVLFFAVTWWFILLAVKYEVGVMGKPLYEAPALLTPIIQITNRIQPYYLGVLFILVHKGRRSVLLLGILSMIVLGVLRAGLGVLLYIGLALLVRYYPEIKAAVKRHRVKIAIACCALPLLVAQLYALRASLRETEDVELEMAVAEIITGRLMGRLSSLSDSAMVFQESRYFESAASSLDPLYFQRQAIGGIFGVALIPEDIPERLLINMDGGSYTDNSYMLGVPGNLYVASLVSPMLVVLDIATLLACVLLTFAFARKLAFPHANEFAFILVLYPLTSGVATEFSFLAVSVLTFCVVGFLLNVRVVLRRDQAGIPARIGSAAPTAGGVR